MEDNKKSFSPFKIIGLIIVVVAIVLAIMFLLPKTKSVVAEVNGSQITQTELDKKVAQTKDFIKGNGNSTEGITTEQEKELQTNVLEGMITEKLVADYATENNISVTAEELDAEYAKVETAAGGKDKLEVEIKKFNTTKDRLREDIRSTIIFRKSVEKYVGVEKLAVTEAEVLNTYNALVAEAKAKVPPVTEPIPSFEEAKVALKEQIAGQKITTEAQVLIQFLRGKADIKTFLE